MALTSSGQLGFPDARDRISLRGGERISNRHDLDVALHELVDDASIAKRATSSHAFPAPELVEMTPTIPPELGNDEIIAELKRRSQLVEEECALERARTGRSI